MRAGEHRRRVVRGARTDADGFRNFLGNHTSRSPDSDCSIASGTARLTRPEMTALVGGLRVLGANAGGSKHGVFTQREGTLSNDFFVNLLDMTAKWQPSGEYAYEARDRRNGERDGPRRTAI